MGALRLWWETFVDICSTAPREHLVILMQDLRVALRSLRRTPVFTGAAVFTLAVGMSAVVIVLTVINTFMLRPLPVRSPEELVSISTRDGHGNFPHGLSFPDLQDYRTANTVLTDALGYTARSVALDAGRGAERVAVDFVTDNYFSLLGVSAAAGRLIQPNEGRAAGEAPVLVLAYDYWQARFGGDPSLIGQTARINGQPFTIIGITSQTFKGTEALIRVSGYVPVWMFDAVTISGASRLQARDDHLLTVLGRMAPGVSIEQVRAALDSRVASLARQYPKTNAGVALFIVPESQARPNPNLGPMFRFVAIALSALAAVLLLITSANVINLVVARAADRGPEVALRTALGARRGRVVRQLITETVVLSFLASAIAVPVVMSVMRRLEQFIAQMTSVASIRPDFSLDARVVLITFGVAITAGVLAGLAPAAYAFNLNLGSLIKSGSRQSQGEPRGWLRGGLVVVQIALSLALLVSGGLFARSLGQARNVDLGFESNGLVTASTDLSMHGFGAVRRQAFFNQVETAALGRPGTESAAWISWLPFANAKETVAVYPEGRPPAPDAQTPSVFTARTSPTYFSTAGVRIVDGRGFTPSDDAASEPIAVINETAARRLWPNERAIGRRLVLGPSQTMARVVGIVRNGKYGDVSEGPSEIIYRPIAQDVPTRASLVIRTSTNAEAALSMLREAVRLVDPAVALYDIRSMDDYLTNGNAFSMFRLAAFVTALFGTTGVLLASIGLYGMIAYRVSRRTREFGLRMALGARAGDIIRDVLISGGRIGVLGIVVGTVMAAMLGVVLRALLLNVSPFDPVTYLGVVLLLLAICVVAAFLPAKRATGISPLEALRTE